MRLHVETSIASETCSPRSISLTSLGTSLAATAARSSTSTGALRWESPTTNTVMTTPPPGGVRRRSRKYSVHRMSVDGPVDVGGLGPARDVEGEDLQLHREVDLADLDLPRHLQHHRREVEDAAHPGRDQLVAHRLRGLPGR